MKYKGTLLAVGWVALANVVVMAGVAYNRDGAPSSRLTLTAREVVPTRTEYGVGSEDSSLALRIEWQRPVDGVTKLLDRAKLQALGFDLPPPNGAEDWNRHKLISPRSAFVVLEYAGPAWQALLQERRQELAKALEHARDDAARQRLKAGFARFEQRASRLVLVDVGTDPAMLRSRYPDPARDLITRARIVAYRHYAGSGKDRRPEIYGTVTGLLPARISVPHRWRQDFLSDSQSINRALSSQPLPGYRVTLAYGRRYEPWIQAVQQKPGD